MILAQLWSEAVSQWTPFQLTALGLFTVVFATYWLLGLAFLALDYFQFPAILYDCKIQKVPLDTASLPRLFRVLLLGQACVLLPTSLLLSWLSECGYGIVVTEEMPLVPEVLCQMLFFVLWEEVSFYYSHRLLHQPALYTRYHKIHHEWKAPIALAASYAHPVELALNNVLPLVIGPFVCRSHLLTTCLWFIIAIVGSQVHHCGYRFWFAHLPFDHQPFFHDFHHENFSGNYGLLSVLDWLHGTDQQWRAAVNKHNAKQN